MLALFLSFLQVGDEDAGEAFLTENQEKEKEVEKEEVQISDVRKGAVWAIVREFIEEQTGEQPQFMQDFSLSKLLAWGEDKFPEVFGRNLTKHVILNSPNIFGLAEGDDDTIYIESPREAEQALASMVNYQAEARKQDLSPSSSNEEVVDEEEVEEEPGTDHREENPLSSAGEELEECMDCFRQWTHLCTEDKENYPDVEQWRTKPQDTEHGGNGRMTASVPTTSVPSSQEGHLSEGSEERTAKKVSSTGKLEAGKEKPESTEETQSMR